MKCSLGISNFLEEISAAVAKSLQLCPTLCDPRDGSPSGSPVPRILQARTWEWVAISFSKECTEELYKKDLHNQDNQDGVITHLEPDILECEVKWALGSITTNKASGDRKSTRLNSSHII